MMPIQSPLLSRFAKSLCLSLALLVPTSAVAEFKINERNLQRVSFDAFMSAITTTSVSKAAAYANHFCTSGLPSFGAIQRKLRNSGYLLIGRDNKGTELYASRKGNPVMAVSPDATFGAVCGAAAASKRLRPATVKKAFEANLKTTLTTLPIKLQTMERSQVWVSTTNPKLAYAFAMVDDLSFVVMLKRP